MEDLLSQNMECKVLRLINISLKTAYLSGV